MTLLLLSSLASATDLEVNAEVGRLEFAKGHWELFDYNQVQPTFGVRADWHKTSRLGFSASYAHLVTGGHNSTWDYWDYWEEEAGSSESTPGANEGFDASFRGHLVGLGVRGGMDLWGWFNPYATVEARGLHAVVRLDDDPYDDDNPNQITTRGTTLGGVAALGLDVRIPTKYGWAISHNLELGYQAMLPLNIGELGSLAVRGLHVRAGAGVRF